MNSANGTGNDDTFIERVWRLSGERNENNDLYKGAELMVNRETDDLSVFVKNSGRKLPRIKIDKTTPQNDFNYFKILEIRQSGYVIDSIKVLAGHKFTTKSQSGGENANYWLIGSVAFLSGLAGFLLYRWRNH